MHPEYDTSERALQACATGNPHFDCRKFGPEDALFLCYLARDRDEESAEAAMDRLRSLLPTEPLGPNLPAVFQTATLVRLGSDNPTLSAAAQELLDQMEQLGVSPSWPKTVDLRQPTGCSQRDELLGRVVADLSSVFGSRLISCYALGSAFDGSSVLTSDIDLHLLMAGTHSAVLKQAVQALAKELSQKHGVDLDLIPFFESDISPWADVRTKIGGIQIFGNCSPDTLTLPPMEEHVPEMMLRAYTYMVRARHHPDSLPYPVTAPNTDDPFLGYASRVHKDGSPSMKELVVVAGWISTALVTHQARCYVASKAASYAAYRQHVADEWTGHLEDVFGLVRGNWNYRVPESSADRARLEAICQRQVAFENHFLEVFQHFLQEESASNNRFHAARAKLLLQEVFPVKPATAATGKSLLVPVWQLSTKPRKLDPRLVSVDHFLVKVGSLRDLGDKNLRQAYQRMEDFGVIVFACRNTLDLKYDLLGLQNYFGQVVFHPRSDRTGITSVRNLFKPEEGFVGTTNAMQTAHTDGSFRKNPPGILALQTEICGLCGGESVVVFGDALYEHMEREHPRELQELFRDDAYTIGRGAESCIRPVLWKENGRVHIAYRNGNGEELEVSRNVRRGFNQIFSFVNDAANQLTFRLPANHVLVVDNHRNLHGRKSWPSDTVRCLNRLWLDGNVPHPSYPGLGLRVGSGD